MDCSGQCAYPSELQLASAKSATWSSSGQCAYPSELELRQLLRADAISSGQCAYPSELQSQCANRLILKEIFVFRGPGKSLHGLKKIELIRRFLRGLSATSAVGDGAFVLLVCELKDMHFAARRQTPPHCAAQGVQLGLAGAKAHVHAELAHLEAHVEQRVAKLRGRLALGFFYHRQIEHHQHPHKSVPGQHGAAGKGINLARSCQPAPAAAPARANPVWRVRPGTPAPAMSPGAACTPSPASPLPLSACRHTARAPGRAWCLA